MIGTTMADLTYDGIEVGSEFGPWQYPLKERIARHLEAVENNFSWHREKSPWGPPVAPPSILTIATRRFLDSLGTLPPGTVHAEHELESISALRLDRRLIGYGRFIGKYARNGRHYVVFEARYRTETGLIMGHSRARMVLPGQGETEEGREEAGAGAGELDAISRTLPPEKITAYSEDTADALRGQSIHLQPTVAKAAGYDGTVAEELMAADYLSELMTGVFGQGWFLSGRMSLAFLRPALCNDTLTANGRVTERIDQGSVTRRVYQVWCQNQRGETVALGTASGLLPSAGQP
jgi:acyl dehydratase